AVPIDADDARLRIAQRERFFDALRAASHWLEVDVAAGRAGARHAFLGAAVVTAQAPVPGMQDEVRRAAAAARRPAARLAGKHRRIAPPVDENEALLAARKALADRGEGRFGEAVFRGIGAQVQGPHHGQLRARRGALGELDALVAPLVPVVPGLE